MRVLAVTHEGSQTGAVRSYLHAVEAMVDLGWQVHAVAKESGSLLDSIQAEQVTIMSRLPAWRLRRIARIRRLSHFAAHLERRLAAKVIDHDCPDVVYASSVICSEFAQVAVEAGVPAVVHVHEDEPLLSWGLRRGRVMVDSPALHFVAPTAQVVSHLRTLGARSVVAAPGPIEVAEPGPTPLDAWTDDVYRVLTVATPMPAKGTEDLLDVVARLPSVDGRPVEFVWIGEGAELEELRSETERRGLASRLRWLGSRNNVADYLAAADVFVLPTHKDVQPLAVLEAVALGTAAIAYGVGSIPEMLVDPRALAEPRDPADLARKVTSALRDRALREELISAAGTYAASALLPSWRSTVIHSITHLALRSTSGGDAESR